MNETIILCIIAGFPLAVLIFLSYVFFKDTKPYTFFKLHTTLFKLGLYKVTRRKNSFSLKDFNGIKVEFQNGKRYNSSASDYIHIKARNDYYIFDFDYHLSSNTIENFDSSEDFAKQVNLNKFTNILKKYIPSVLKKEYGKMPPEDILNLHMNNTVLSDKRTLNEEILKIDKVEPIQIDGFLSFEIQDYIKLINEKAENIQLNIDKMDIEDSHQFYKLINKHIPLLLKEYAEMPCFTKDKETKEIIQMLDKTLEKMQEWIDSNSGIRRNVYEKEKTLIRNIIQ